MVSATAIGREKLKRYFLKDDHFFPSPSTTARLVGSAVQTYSFERLVVDRVEVFSRLAPGRKRLAVDLTFSAPKSVSILFGVGEERDRQAAVESHRYAVDKTLGYMETAGMLCVQKKVHADVRLEPAIGILALLIEHGLSRELDPQLHSHALVANEGMDPKERLARSIDFGYLFRNLKHLDRVYLSFLRAALEQRGYRCKRAGKGFELACITRSQIEAFSCRSKQVETNLSKRGLSRKTANGAQRQSAALYSRKAKRTDHDPTVLRSLWVKTAARVSLKVERELPLQKSVEEAEGDKLDLIREGLKALLTTRVQISRMEALDFILKYSMQVAGRPGLSASKTLTADDIWTYLPGVLRELTMIRLPGQSGRLGCHISEVLISVEKIWEEARIRPLVDVPGRNSSVSGLEVGPLRDDGTPGSPGEMGALDLFLQGVSAARQTEYLRRIFIAADRHVARTLRISERQSELIDQHKGLWTAVPRRFRKLISDEMESSRKSLRREMRSCQEKRPTPAAMTAIENQAAELIVRWEEEARAHNRIFLEDPSPARYANHAKRQERLCGQFAANLCDLKAQTGLDTDAEVILAGLRQLVMVAAESTKPAGQQPSLEHEEVGVSATDKGEPVLGIAPGTIGRPEAIDHNWEQETDGGPRLR